MSGRLPTFFLAGAERSGTTTLARYLDAHPDVYIPREKEVHFFDLADRPLDAYQQRFAAAGNAVAIGDATPSYLFHEHAIRGIAETVPSARFLVSLRAPIERARSHHRFATAWGLERRSLEQALIDELDGHAPAGAEYLARGRYAEQLERLERLHPTAEVHVLLLDDLRAAAHDTVRAVYRFVGVDDRHVPDVGPFRNRAQRPRSLALWNLTSRWRRGPLGPVTADERETFLGRVAAHVDAWNGVGLPDEPVPASLMADLNDFFAGDVARLSRRLGRDLGHWLGTPTRQAVTR